MLSAEQVAGLKATIVTHERIMARLSGRRDGWCAAVDEIRQRAGEAFARGDDQTATSLRELARDLLKHPAFAQLRADEEHSVGVIERAQGALDAVADGVPA